MTTTLPSLPPRSKPRQPDSSPEGVVDIGVLEDKIPEYLRAPRTLVAYTVLLGIAYVFLNHRLLWHTDLWGHLAYGRLIWEGMGLPSTEPLMPLAAGVPFVDTAWMSQLIGYGAFRIFGVTAMSFLYAATITLCMILLLWRFHERTQSFWISVCGLISFAWVDWQQLMIVRPQLAGFLCFVVLLIRLTAKRATATDWILIPLLFALWANLHGSFPVGLVLLACFAIGRMIDVSLRTRSVKAILHDNRARRYLLLTELAAAAVLLNPYGLAIYAEVLAFGSSANLADLVEWAPLNLRMSQGQAAAAIALALMIAYRLSPRRVSATEFLLLAGIGAGALWTSRLILWWAPVAAYYLVLHVGSIRRRCRSQRGPAEALPRSGRWSIVAVALGWIFFGLTPFASHVLHGREIQLEKAVSPFTPVAAVEHLKKNPPQGQVFNTYEWGDYLTWTGPADLQVFVASHAHLVPSSVWRDYLRIIHNSADWEELLDRYGVNTVIVDYRYREGFIKRMKSHDDWRLTFDDSVCAAVFVRKQPILTGRKSDQPREKRKEAA